MEPYLHHTLIEFVRRQGLFEQNDTIILAISGGIDSVVLAHLLNKMGQPMVLAHCNFNLRGEESRRDEAFVRNLAGSMAVPVEVIVTDTKAFAVKNKLSIQVAARQIRYTFFEELRVKLTAPGKRVFIATAHHANDVAETVLINLFRGTGIDGLRGIPAKNGYVVRPLLFAKREEIEAYASEHKLTWVDDSSNEKEDYTRNFIRHTVLSAVAKQFPGVVDQITGTADKLKDVAAIYYHGITRKLAKWVQREGDQQKIPVQLLLKEPQVNALLWEWIKDFGFTEGQLNEVKKLLVATNASYVASATHKIIRNRAWLLLIPENKVESTFFVVDSLPAKVLLPAGKAIQISSFKTFKKEGLIPGLPAGEAVLDAGNLVLPLIIRPWKAGDYFYPLGMEKKKKVARFLIDQKVSPVEKPEVYVVESEKRIVWVVGYRIDDRFKVSQNTKEWISMKVAGAVGD